MIRVMDFIIRKFKYVFNYFEKRKDAGFFDIENPKVWKGVFFSVFCGFLTYYLYYAFNAWFLMDDFTFIKLYSNNLHITDIYYLTENFGRFITRNLYWYILLNFFGKNACWFFIINLLIIILNSIIIYKIVKFYFEDAFMSISAATIYFAGFPTVVNYGWISNSQHLIAHTFILGFIHVLVNRDIFINNNYKDKILLFVLFILGLYSNIYSFFVLPVMVVYLIINRKKFENSTLNFLFIIILFLSGSFFIIILMKSATGPYEAEISLKAFLNVLQFYITGITALPFELTFILTALLSLIIIKKIIIDKDEIIIIFGVAAICFYIPFAFGAQHKYSNYMALSFLSLNIILFYLLKKYKKIILILILIFIFQNISSIYIYAKYPTGGNVREFIDEFNRIDIKEYKTVAFKPYNKDVEVLWGAPNFWWILGFGSGLEMFSDPGKEYILYDERMSHENEVIVELDNYMKIQGIIPGKQR